MKRPTQRATAAIIVLVGGVLLFSALLVPWYSVQSQRGGGPATNFGTYNATYYLDPPGANGAIQYSCYGQGRCVSQNSYASGSQNNTGVVAGVCFFLVAMGGILGAVAGIAGVLFRGPARRTSPRMVLAMIALLLGIVASSYFTLALPGAFSADLPGFGAQYSSGPWHSFYGSANFTNPYIAPFTVYQSYTWGPLIGWYLSIAATVVLALGAITLYRCRNDPPEPSRPPPAVSP